jgi:hypothetical protein
MIKIKYDNVIRNVATINPHTFSLHLTDSCIRQIIMTKWYLG